MSFFQRKLGTLALVATAVSTACVSSALEERGPDSDEYAMRKELAAPTILARRELNVGILCAGMPDSGVATVERIFSQAKNHVDAGMSVFRIGGESADHTLGNAPRRIDILVAAGDGSSSMLTDFAKDRGERADYLLSLGTGAYLLARGGLLDGVHVTTVPDERQSLANGFPDVIVHERMSFVHDGKAITSVGGDEAQDAALYLCEHLYGGEVAHSIAADLGLDWNPDQVSSLIPKERPDDPSGLVGDAIDRAQAEGSRLRPR